MTKHKKVSKNRRYPVQNRNLKANRQYKDTIFRMLFKDKQNLPSLYNAVNRRNYTDANALQVVTLENAIYLGMKNDLAFIMDLNLYLYEHQSTYNPNMPLRDLFYISSEYQKLVVQKSLYSSTLQKIPAPKFVVFYNGAEPLEDLSELKLSSAYECIPDNPDLELRVTVLNVNEGILADFLIKNQAELVHMSIFEYNKEEEEKKLRKAEFEAGREVGRKELFNHLIQKMLAKGKSPDEIADELDEPVSVIQNILKEYEHSDW